MNKVVIDQGLGWSLITWILLRLIRSTYISVKLPLIRIVKSESILSELELVLEKILLSLTNLDYRLGVVMVATSRWHFLRRFRTGLALGPLRLASSARAFPRR